jgi:hypothetical protein
MVCALAQGQRQTGRAAGSELKSTNTRTAETICKGR